MNKTEWGVTIGIKQVPEPEFVASKTGAYAWKIDKHGLYIFADTKAECKAEFIRYYESETGFKFN